MVIYLGSSSHGTEGRSRSILSLVSSKSSTYQSWGALDAVYELVIKMTSFQRESQLLRQSLSLIQQQVLIHKNKLLS